MSAPTVRDSAGTVVAAIVACLILALAFTIKHSGEQHAPPTIDMQIIETERQAAEVMCKARIFEAVINERVRLTGMTNPPSTVKP